MQGRIIEIVNDWGMQTKKDGGKYGPCMVAKVVLENDEEARILVWQEGKGIGDVLDLEKKGDYWNVVSQKQLAENAKHDEIMKGLRNIYALLTRVEARISRLEGGDDTSTSPEPERVQQALNKAEPASQKPWDKWKKDTVHPVHGDEDINLPDNW